MCPGIEPTFNREEGTCPNLAETGPNHWCWSAYPFSNKAALDADSKTGRVLAPEFTSLTIFALCK